MNDSPAFSSFGPRSMFYSARDLTLGKPGLPEPVLSMRRSARQRLVNEAVKASELLISSIRATRSFDELGNIELLVPQIEEARADALAKVNSLLESISRTNARVRAHANREYTEPRDSLEALQDANPAIGRQVSEEALAAAVDAANGIGADLFAGRPTPAMFDPRKARALAADRKAGRKA